MAEIMETQKLALRLRERLDEIHELADKIRENGTSVYFYIPKDRYGFATSDPRISVKISKTVTY